MTEYYGTGDECPIDYERVQSLELEETYDHLYLICLFSIPYIIITWTYIFINYLK